MDRWFTHFQGPWNLQTVVRSLSDDYAREIKSLVEQLNLVPEKGSPKHSEGIVEYKDDRINVNVKEFVFGDFQAVYGDYGRYYTPVFTFSLVVMAKKLGRVRRGEAAFEVVYKGPLVVTFGEDYPHRYPFFVLPKYRNTSFASHEHHMYAGGQMCLYQDFGHSQAAWDQDHDTTATTFGPAMRWIVWHERDRQNGVSADDVA